MTYNSNDIVNKGVVIESELGGQKAQVGYDLSVCAIEEIVTNNTEPIVINEKSKIQNIHYNPISLDEEGYWNLKPNTQYAITFDQGCCFHNNEFGRIISRSSLNRAGMVCLGVVFDPGFQTEHIGCTLFTGNNGFRVHEHARLAQMQVFESNPLPQEELYNGQWQNLANH